MTPDAVLRTFAELAVERSDEVRTSVLSRGATFMWQRYKALDVFKGKSILVSGMPFEQGLNKGSSLSKMEDRVLATAALHEGERRLFVGWIWFSGTVTNDDGSQATYCFPAVSVPVAYGFDYSKMGRFRQTAGNVMTPHQILDVAKSEGSLIAAGDVDLTDLVTGTADRERLLNARNYGRGELRDMYMVSTNEYTPVPLDVFPQLTELNAWIADIAKTLNLPIRTFKAAHQGLPVETMHNDYITVHIGSALYLEPPVWLGVRSESLSSLGRLRNLDESALATLYDQSSVAAAPIEPVTPLRPLSRRQQSLAKQTLSAPLGVLTGAPGTGKSHVLSVIAMNAIARGESVLVVAGSPHAVDVLVEHFAQSPGPPPVVFGGSRHGQQIARDLADLGSQVVSISGAASVPYGHEVDDHERLLASAHAALEIESELVRMQRNPAIRLDLADQRDRAGDLHELDDLLRRCERGGPVGLASRMRHKKQIVRRLGDTADHRSVLNELMRGAEAQRLDAAGGLSLSDTYDAIIEIERAAADQVGRGLTNGWLAGIDSGQRAALAQVSTALTSGRAERRRMFAAIAPDDLTRAAPLWIGSIRDVEDVLPEIAGLFDLLIVDEAAQIDQLNAVHALVRAKRTVVCGDPQQLDHVSYMSASDRTIASKQDLDEEDPLNVRERSLFDVAASRSPVLVLDEHFRSAPHIIEFSARRMYDGDVHIVGRNPSNESADHIHVVHTDGRRDVELVNAAEVQQCVALAEQLIADGHRSIGFVSPFEEQAQAIEEAVLDRWQLEEIDAYGLRVGTVHGLQGDERDVIIASWAIGPDEDTTAWTFVNQPNLFNVMITRAREHVYVVTSEPSPPGLAGDYLRWSEPLTNLVRDIALDDPWIMRVAETIRTAGHSVRVGYAVGRHHIDLVMGEPDSPIAIDCLPHREGPAAHTDRALQLRRMGWRTADVFESKWSERLGELEIELEHM